MGRSSNRRIKRIPEQWVNIRKEQFVMKEIKELSIKDLNEELDHFYFEIKILKKKIIGLEDKVIEIKEELLKRKNQEGWKYCENSDDNPLVTS